MAVLGIVVHLWRHPSDRASERAVEVALIWWLVVTIGIATEVGFGDLALGVVAVLAIWFRDRFLLAVLIVAAISPWGMPTATSTRRRSTTTMIPTTPAPCSTRTSLFPLVAIALYAVRERWR